MEISKILDFLKTINGLKDIVRFKDQFYWKDYEQRERYESVADHTWRMAIMLIVIEKYLSEPIDVAKALKMVLLHDIAEVITGDLSPTGEDGTGKGTYAFDASAAQNKYEDEKRAAVQIFSKLPEDIGKELFDLWMEYEKQEVFEAKVAKALDKIEAKLQVSEYRKGHMFKDLLEFSVQYQNKYFDVDPAIKELGLAVNEEIRAGYREFKE